MIALDSTGKYEDFVNGLARTGAASNEGEEQKFNEAFRNFVKEVKEIYSDNSLFSSRVNGSADHGGASVTLFLSITAYPAESTEKKEAEIPAYDRKDADVKGEVHKDAKTGHQVAKPKAAETKLGE